MNVEAEVRIRVIYSYDEEGYPQADFLISLSADDNGKLHPMLRNRNILFFNETLDEDWGYVKEEEEGKKYRHTLDGLRGESWEEVKQKVREKVKDEVEKIKEVYEKNLENLPYRRNLVVLIEFEFPFYVPLDEAF